MSRSITQSVNHASHQQTNVPSGMKHEYLNIASVSQPSFGSTFQINLTEKGIILHNAVLQFNVSAITGLTGTVTSYPHFVPCHHWISKIEIVLSGTVIDTVYPEKIWLTKQYLSTDPDRELFNEICGNYKSIIRRNALSTTASSWYCELGDTFINQAHPKLLPGSTHDIQLRITMNPLAPSLLGTGPYGVFKGGASCAD